MATTGYRADLDLARSLADSADAITLDRFGAGDLAVTAKPDLTPVTDADHAVEDALRIRLADERPDDAVVGEELGSAGSARRTWIIDPIDGTKNFVRGVPVWATLIGLLDGDQAVVGVASAPALGRRWWAAHATGAWLATLGRPPRRLAVSRIAAIADASFSYASIGAWTARGKLDEFVGLTERVWRTRAYGDFWSYMMVAEGSVDMAAEPELSLWDMAALAPIVTEAGGRFTGLNGRPGVTHGNAAASNGILHDALLDALGD
jgi:histidinol-phosphatase